MQSQYATLLLSAGVHCLSKFADHFAPGTTLTSYITNTQTTTVLSSYPITQTLTTSYAVTTTAPGKSSGRIDARYHIRWGALYATPHLSHQCCMHVRDFACSATRLSLAPLLWCRDMAEGRCFKPCRDMSRGRSRIMSLVRKWSYE